MEEKAWWNCEACTCKNPPTADACGVCGFLPPRPEGLALQKIDPNKCTGNGMVLRIALIDGAWKLDYHDSDPFDKEVRVPNVKQERMPPTFASATLLNVCGVKPQDSAEPIAYTYTKRGEAYVLWDFADTVPIKGTKAAGRRVMHAGRIEEEGRKTLWATEARQVANYLRSL